MLGPDARIDRGRLADAVFSDSIARADLNAIVHPAVEGVVRDRLAAEEAAGTAVVVLEVPLLIEAGWNRLVSAVVVVDCPDKLAIARLVASRGMSADDARRRLAAQAGRAERNAHADVVICNDGSLDDLRGAVEAATPDLGLPCHPSSAPAEGRQSGDAGPG